MLKVSEWLANASASILGIHSDIAEQKLEHWSSVAPLALEVVLSIGQKARDGTLSGQNPFQNPSFGLLIMIIY
jgi:hypothetical protein